MSSRRRLALFTVVTLVGGCVDYEVIEVDGVRRKYIEHIPDGEAPPGGWPLVLAYHGAYSTPAQMAEYTGLDAVAEDTGFIVVYPKGKLRLWNDGRVRDAYDDVAFTDALIDRMLDRHGVDPARVYVTGISNGAFMSHRLACELAPRIAAIAPVAGSLSEELVAACEPAVPMPVMLIMGTDDALVPYEGGALGGNFSGGRFGTMLSAEETAAHWAGLSGCVGAEPDRETDEVDDGTSVQTRRFTECDSGAEVVLHTVEGGGHTWPGARHITGLGPVSEELEASEVIWSFFERHRRAPPRAP